MCCECEHTPEGIIEGYIVPGWHFSPCVHEPDCRNDRHFTFCHVSIHTLRAYSAIISIIETIQRVCFEIIRWHIDLDISTVVRIPTAGKGAGILNQRYVTGRSLCETIRVFMLESWGFDENITASLCDELDSVHGCNQFYELNKWTIMLPRFKLLTERLLLKN